jgi:hypothetical protein
MTDLRRSIVMGVLNFTIAPLIMVMSAQALGVDAKAWLAIAYTMFWPAFVANAGLQIEINSPEWNDRRRRFAIPLFFAEILFLPLLVTLMLWLNPGVALFLQDATGWILGAAVAGGTNRIIDALRAVALDRFATTEEKRPATEQSGQSQ